MHSPRPDCSTTGNRRFWKLLRFAALKCTIVLGLCARPQAQAEPRDWSKQVADALLTHSSEARTARSSEMTGALGSAGKSKG